MRKRKGKKKEKKGGEGGKLLDPCPPFGAVFLFFSYTSPSSLNLKLHTNGNMEKERGAKETSDDGTG